MYIYIIPHHPLLKLSPNFHCSSMPGCFTKDCNITGSRSQKLAKCWPDVSGPWGRESKNAALDVPVMLMGHTAHCFVYYTNIHIYIYTYVYTNCVYIYIYTNCVYIYIYTNCVYIYIGIYNIIYVGLWIINNDCTILVKQVSQAFVLYSLSQSSHFNLRIGGSIGLLTGPKLGKYWGGFHLVTKFW